MADMPHVVLSYQEDLPVEFVDEFRQCVENEHIDLVTEVRRRVPFASLEWTVPTMVVLYVFKSYFDAFLKEAGKDHYTILKKGVGLLLKRLMPRKSEDSLIKRTLRFSIVSKTRDGTTLKFIFPEAVSEELYSEIVASSLGMLGRHCHGEENDQLTEILAAATPFAGTFYLEFSLANRSWVVMDWKAEIEHHRMR